MTPIIIQKGDRGPQVPPLKRAMNRRRDDRDLPPIKVSDTMGTPSWEAWHETYIALGGKPGTFAGGWTRAFRRYRIVRWPGTRGSLARKRAREWRANRGKTGIASGRAFARRYQGKKENPAGSNTGDWGLTAWQRSFGDWLVGLAWCGVFVGKILQAAGVEGINHRVASVWNILQDGLAGRNGFRSCVYRRATGHGSTANVRAGDVVGLYGESTHVEWVDEVVKGGVWTYGGNTSAGAGSVSNGGQVARNFRPWSVIVYAVRPNYPKG
jgi:hypothetical protein